MITLLFAYIFHPRIFNTSKVFHTPDQDSNDQFRFGPNGMNMNGMNNLWNAGGGIGGMMGGAAMPPPILPRDDQDQQRRRKRLTNDTALDTATTTTPVMFYQQQAQQHHAFNLHHGPHNQAFENAFTQALIPSFSTMPSVYNVNTLNKQHFGDK
jgi:hypothetical protein